MVCSANRAALKFRCLLLTFPREDQSRRLQSPSDFSPSDPSCADSYVFLLTLASSAKKPPVNTPAQTCGCCQSVLFNLGPEWEELGIPRRDRCAVRYGGAVSVAISFCVSALVIHTVLFSPALPLQSKLTFYAF